MKKTIEQVRCDNCLVELFLKEDNQTKINKPFLDAVVTYRDALNDKSLVGQFCTITCLVIKNRETQSIAWTKEDKLKALYDAIHDIEKETFNQKQAQAKKDEANKLREEADKVEKDTE